MKDSFLREAAFLYIPTLTQTLTATAFTFVVLSRFCLPILLSRAIILLTYNFSDYP